MVIVTKTRKNRPFERQKRGKKNCRWHTTRSRLPQPKQNKTKRYCVFFSFAFFVGVADYILVFVSFYVFDYRKVIKALISSHLIACSHLISCCRLFVLSFAKHKKKKHSSFILSPLALIRYSFDSA